MPALSGRLARLAAAAWEGVASRRTRSGLAALGLMVGVAAVVLMVAIGQGTRNHVLSQVTALGSDLITVWAAKSAPTGARITTSKDKASLSPADAQVLGRMHGVRYAVPGINRSQRISAQGVTTDTTLVVAPPEIFAVEGHLPVEGHFYGEREERLAQRVAVVGPSLRQRLVGEASLVGQTIEIKKQPFLVIAELAPKGLDPNGTDLDDRLYLPLRTGLSRLLGGRRHVDYITVQGDGSYSLDQLQEEIRALLRQRHRLTEPGQRDDFNIHTQLETIQTQEESSRLFSALITGVAGISLLVAGIGIMAVMLIGVRERTPEIGVRRAVGARRRDILVHFLLEALILGLGGGLAGAALGLGLAASVRRFSDLSYPLPWFAAGVALVVSLSIALVFGLWPARRAAALTPVEAVRDA
ncbi:MAG: ABC transporter permease [Desulfarculus sp.]|nr:ABC transporter permease [Desulfarculus sp.]